jgi:hypothetical protein
MSTTIAEGATISSSPRSVDNNANNANNANNTNTTNDPYNLDKLSKADHVTHISTTNDPYNLDKLSKADHVTHISLHTHQDVTQAKTWVRSEEFHNHPVLSELEFTFCAVYDKVDGTTIIRIGRKAFRPDPAVGHERPLIASLGLKGIDLTQKFIPARIRNVFDEVAKNGDVWIARLVSIKSRDLLEGGYAMMQYYDLFKAIGLRKKGKDWDMADLESVIEFLDYRRDR